MAWLGKLDEAGRLGVQQAVDGARKSIEQGSGTEHMQPLGRQLRFEFDDDQSAVQSRWVEVNAAGVRVENLRHFGGPWITQIDPSTLRSHRQVPGNESSLTRVGGHDRGEKPEFTSLLRSDTLKQHQSDPRHRSNLLPARRQKDDTNRVDFAARTAWVDVTGAVCDCA